MASLEIVLEEYHGPALSDEDKVRLAEKKNDLYRASLQFMTPADLSDEVRDTLNALRARGIKLAIGSSSKNAPLILERIGLGGYFDAVSDGNNITHPSPIPRCSPWRADAESACRSVSGGGGRAGRRQAAAAGGFHSAGIGPAAKSGLATYPLNTFSDLLKL